MKFFLFCLYCCTTLVKGEYISDSHENNNYSSLLDRMDNLSLTVTGLIGRVNSAEETITNLQSGLSDAKAEVERMANEQEEKLKQALSISQTVANTSIGQLNAEVGYLKLQVNSLNEKNGLLNNEVTSLKEHERLLCSEVLSSNEKNRLRKSELMGLRNHVADMKNTTEGNLAKTLSLDASNKILTDAIEMLKKVVEGLKSVIPQTTTVPPTPNEWITIQRRGTKLPNGVTRQNFNLGWVEYANGFGDSRNNDFWLGLDKIAHLTRIGDYELRVDLESRATEDKYATYKHFQVSNATDNYRLTVSGYSGTAGDALSYSNNMEFTTKDHGNYNKSSNCAVDYDGGWWSDDCGSVRHSWELQFDNN